jgi:glutathione S-transferase
MTLSDLSHPRDVRLELYAHPLASYCWKTLIVLYDANIAFENRIVDLSDPEQRAALEQIWPVGKFPVLRDRRRGVDVPESTIINEYLAEQCGAQALFPLDHARSIRLWDRFFDQYVMTPMQKIVSDHRRAENEHAPRGVADARAMLAESYAYLDRELAKRPDANPWIVGDGFTLADCSAFPALFYADLLVEIAPFPHAAAYLAALRERPSIVRVVDEARPYFQYFPVPTTRLPR